MNVHIGTDIVTVKRISDAIQSPAFIRKVFTPDELSYAQNDPMRLAGFFACKEAVVKAFQTGFSICLPKDIEVIHKNNIPHIRLHGNAKTWAADQQVLQIQISLAHETDIAIAFSIVFFKLEK